MIEYLIFIFLLIVTIFVFCIRPRFKRRKKKKISEKELEEECEKWKSAPLVPRSYKSPTYTKKIITQGITNFVSFEGYPNPLNNFGSFNFLGLNMNKKIIQTSYDAISSYGIGSGGPRGFYGTFDSHYKCEDVIAKFIGKEDCIVYSFGVVCTSSAINCYVEKEDFIVVDEGVGFPVQTGCNLSKAKVYKFKHNDIADAERQMEIVEGIAKKKKKLPRKFLIIQGVYENYGDIIKNFGEFIDLAKKFKYYIFLEDSFSFGVLGKTGRGTCEHFGVDPKMVDFIIGSLEYSFASSGGFCCGTALYIRYQRMFGNGYMFSCSGPPFSSSIAVTGLEILQKENLSIKLQKNVELMIELLQEYLGKGKGKYELGCSKYSPIITIKFSDIDFETLKSYEVNFFDSGVFIDIPTLCELEWRKFKPFIRICLSSAHTVEQIQTGSKIISDIVKKIVKSSTKN